MGQTYKADFEVDNGTDFDKYNFSTSADQVSYTKNGKETNVQTELDELNTGLLESGSLELYVTFTYYGDYWWISSPIFILNPDKYSIKLADNIKNINAGSGNMEISADLFRVKAVQNNVYILTNNQDIAGYIFKTVRPNVIWTAKLLVTAK